MTDLVVADPWFVRTGFADGITLVSEPHVHPLLRCNVWHVRGRDRDLVVDTALGLAPLRPYVAREGGGDLLAVATHSHSDHVGGLHEFEHRAAHRSEAERLAGGVVGTLEARHLGAEVTEPYRAAGYDIPELLIDALPPTGRPEELRDIPSAPLTRTLDEGDVVDLGDRSFTVLHLPGHSPGSIGLWEAASGVLFAGDAVYDGPLLDDLDGSDIDDYVATMERLRVLPVTVVHAGHEPSFGRERLVELCDAYLARRRPAR